MELWLEEGVGYFRVGKLARLEVNNGKQPGNGVDRYEKLSVIIQRAAGSCDSFRPRDSHREDTRPFRLPRRCP